MAKHVLTAILAVVVLACSPSEPVVEEPMVREPIGMYYVGVPQMQVHLEPSETAEVVSSYREGEVVSVYSEKDGWMEIMRGSGDMGWVRSDSLMAEKETFEEFSTPEDVKFHTKPEKVEDNLGIRGEIAFELTVNEDGKIVGVRTLRNTTGSNELEAKNREEVFKARFFPMQQDGKRKAFIYEHRIRY